MLSSLLHRQLLLLLLTLTTTTRADLVALRRFFEVTDGPRWLNKTNWNTSAPFCTWYGISCQGSDITAIELENNNLVGRVAKLIYHLPNIQYLNFKDNHLTDGAFEGFADAEATTSLEVLNLAGNALTHITGIGRAPPSLLELHFTANQIDSDLPEELFDLTNIKNLYLSFNDMKGTLPTKIGLLKDLEKFYLYGNKVTGSLPSEIGLLGRLKVFTMAENMLIGTIPATVKDMVNLETFSIHNNEEHKGDGLSGKIPPFDTHPYISEFFLDGNQLTGSIPNNFLGNSNASLVTVGLSKNQLTGSLPESLLQFSSLSIDATGNKLTSISDAFCDKGAWMTGRVEQYNCDAILCPVGTFSPDGRQLDDGSACRPCNDGNTFLGATECQDAANAPFLEGAMEFFVLASLYTELEGKNWNKTDGWHVLEHILNNVTNVGDVDGSQIDYCSWHGVKCSANDKVIELNLGSNGLKGTVPNTVFDLPDLQILDLSRNPVTFLPDLSDISNSPQLESLSLSSTKVKTLQGIQYGAGLKHLFLDGLQLGGTMPKGVFQLKKLQTLHMQHSEVKGKLPAEVGFLSNLRVLDLYGNDITGYLPSELGFLTALTLLDLSVNEFSGTFPTQLSGMTSLQKLLLHDDDDVGGLTGSLPSLATFGSLKEISFDNNDLRGIIPSNFLAGITDKTKTITVSLMNNQLTGAIPKSLESFSSLDIRLEDNRISGIDVDCAKVPGWMQGQVGQLVSPDSPCNAILCPPQTYNADGKQRSGNYSICNSCPQAQYYGSTSCGESVNKEKELLDKMYKATGGQYWKKSANWTTPGVPICYREGVVCNGGLDSGVVELLMNDFGMSGKIPPEIFEDLPQVRHLGFTDNLVDLDLKYLDKAINLEVLKMSNTQLRSLKHIEKALPALSEMHFAGIQLSGTLPSQIYSLSNVQKLFLSNNLFTGTISTDISKMSALLEIYLGDNKLTGHIPSDLRNLSKLRTVDIQLNYLSGNLPESFNQLTDLEFVILQGQKGDKKISGPIISFSGSPLITTIDLSKNELTGTIPGDFIDQGSATASIKVDLSFNQIGGTLPASLSKFSNLFINLAENQIVRITDSLCSNGGWMGGKVGDLNTCNAILCGPGTAAPEGRQVSASIPCKECPEILVDAPFYGATACRSHLELNEKNILTEIYAKTNGTNWVQSTNWVSDQSVCSWYGIACNDNGVIQVNLESNGLEASSDVSELFFQLPYLRKLDIKGNDVPLDLTKITTNTSLEEIQISATGLRSTMGIQNAKKTLKRLHVTDNDMSGPFPSELFELTKLVALYMSFNSFTGTLPTEIGLLSKMEEFYLFGNEIKGSIPGASIAKMSNLKEFILSNNYLTGTIPQEFSSLSLLEQLSLYDQRSASLITGTIPNFVGAPKLWYFDVSNNDMKGSIPSDFMDLSVYKDEAITIYLTNNEITGTLPVSLDLFSNMDLDITGNSITGLSGAFCDSDDDGDWMQGNVRKFGCDAILCPPGTFTKSGKQESSDVPCQPCPLLQGDLRFGQNHCDGIASEKSVLLELYRATNGAGWTNRAKWGSKEPICSWEGIKCLTGDDDEYGVTTVDLQNNTLVGTLPSSVFALPFLKQLDLKDNLGLHVSLGGLPSAQSLELLYLSNTKVDTMVGISQAPNLHEVHVTGCGLTGPMPDEIFDLAASLKGLYIAYNAFSGTLSTRIGELTKLEYFYAFDNDFSGTIPTEIGLMSKLSFFVFSENLLSGRIPDEVSSLNKLELFSVYRRERPGNKLYGPLPAFDKNPKLTDLYLDNNDLTGAIPQNFLRSSKDAALINLAFNYLDGAVPGPLVTRNAKLDLRLEGNLISGRPASICNRTQWMGGNIGSVGCEAFLCPIGTANAVGRATAESSCQPCSNAANAPFWGSVSCDPPVKEEVILTNFFRACGGVEWNNQQGWASAEPYCTWHGIECDGRNKVKAIYLGANNLVGTPPPEIFNLPMLETLQLFSNPIDFVFDNIGSAKKLVTLRLDSTGLTSLEGIKEAKSLLFIDVRFNALEGQFSPELLDIKFLRYLNMANNKISGKLPYEFFAGIRYLKTLRLGSNALTGSLASFELNDRLTSLDLSENQLTGKIPKDFLAFVTTTAKLTIDLSGNQLQGSIPIEMDRFKYVTLYLRDNQISNVPEVFCDNTYWNYNDVASYGCDAILCPPGWFNFFGRFRPDQPCMGCLDENPFWGQTTCSHPGSSAPISAKSWITSLVTLLTTIYVFLC